MTCTEFVRWLDDGQPEGAAATAARAHALVCGRCAAELAAAAELETLLVECVTPAPARLTDSVMVRVAAIESMRVANPGVVASPPAGFESPFAWWVCAAAQPAAALALMLAAVTLWQRDMLVVYAGAAIAYVSGWVSRAIDANTQASAWTLPAVEMLARPEVALGIVFAITPAIAWGSWSLWRWAERRV